MLRLHDRHDRHDRHAHHGCGASSDAHSPSAGEALLPVLVWLNRIDLSTRFPAWHPLPPPKTGKQADEDAR